MYKFYLHKYQTYLEFVHELNAGYYVICRLNGYSRSYTVVKSLRQHMRKNHADLYNLPCTSSNNDETEHAFDKFNCAEIEGNASDDSNEEIVIATPVNRQININDFLLGLQKHFALFI